jgi:tetratricopeptide (TPR) repeat protein
LAESRSHYDQARDIQTRLVEQFPSVIAFQRELAMTLNNLGMLLADLGQPDEARAEYERARAILQHLAEQYPKVPAYQVDLGGSYCNFGSLVRDGGKPDESLEWFGKAIAVLTAVITREPRDATAKRFLLNSHRARAVAYDQLQQYAKSLDDWEKALELSPPAEQPRARAGRASSLARLGQVEQAVAEVVELSKLTDWPASEWYNFACIYALASDKLPDKQQAYADRAMELLQRAVQAGFTNAAHLEQDPDLAPLREREDFQKLIGDLDKS